jgi:hypothetical protein
MQGVFLLLLLICVIVYIYKNPRSLCIVCIYVWCALIFAPAVADVAGSSVSGFSSRLVLFVFAHYYVISLYISSCHLLVYVRVCMLKVLTCVFLICSFLSWFPVLRYVALYCNCTDLLKSYLNCNLGNNINKISRLRLPVYVWKILTWTSFSFLLSVCISTGACYSVQNYTSDWLAQHEGCSGHFESP